MQTAVSFLVALATLAFAPKPQAAWRPFQSKEYGFTISMPGAPVAQKQKINTEVGPVPYTIYTVDMQTSAYIVGCFDYGDKVKAEPPVKKLLDGARDGAVHNIQGHLTSDKAMTVEGYPAREFSADTPQGLVFKARMVWAKHRLIMATVVTPKAAASSADVARFLGSLKPAK